MFSIALSLNIAKLFPLKPFIALLRKTSYKGLSVKILSLLLITTSGIKFKKITVLVVMRTEHFSQNHLALFSVHHASNHSFTTVTR
jgi:hypothetical protein